MWPKKLWNSPSNSITSTTRILSKYYLNLDKPRHISNWMGDILGFYMVLEDDFVWIWSYFVYYWACLYLLLYYVGMLTILLRMCWKKYSLRPKKVESYSFLDCPNKVESFPFLTKDKSSNHSFFISSFTLLSLIFPTFFHLSYLFNINS